MTLDPALMADMAAFCAVVCALVGIYDLDNKHAGYLGFGFVVVAFVMWAAA